MISQQFYDAPVSTADALRQVQESGTPEYRRTTSGSA